MEDTDIIGEWDKNLKSILADQAQLKLKNEQIEQKLAQRDYEHQVKSGLVKPGIETSFVNAFGDPENVEKLAKFQRKDTREFTMELKDMNFTTNLPTAAAAVSMVNPLIQAPPPKKFHIRDVLSGVNSTTRDYVYIREDSITGGPSFIPESSIKPSQSFNLSQQTLTCQYLATTVTVSNQLMNDVHDMVNYLQRRLLQQLLDIEDTQLLGGSGVSPNLGGLHLGTNSTGKTGGGPTIYIEELVAGIGQLASYNRQASAIILNPTDYYNIIINKASTAGLYSLPSVVTVDQDGTFRVAGCPVYWNVAQTVGYFDIMDTTGMVLVTRELPSVTFWVDSTMAAKNSVFVRAELREGFAVFLAKADIYAAF